MTLDDYYQQMSNNDLIMLALFVITIVVMLIYARVKHKIPQMKLNLMWIMLGSILIRLPYMAESFWYDETFTSSMARLSFNQLGEAILYDVHPPLAYLPFWAGAQVFGTPDMVLRLPSLVLGLVSIWLAYHIAYEILPARALWGALAVAIMPMHVIYSTEARAYMILIVLVMVGVLAIIRDRPAWFLMVTLLPYTHAHGVIYTIILLFVSMRQKRTVEWIGAYGVILSTGFYAVILLMIQSLDVSDGFWLRQAGIGGVLGLLPNSLIGGRYLPIFAIVLIPFTFWLAIRAYNHFRLNTWARLVLFICIAVPLATTLIAWGLDLNIILARAMLPTAVLWAILMGLYKPRVYVALVIIPLVYGVVSDYQRMDIRGMIADCQNTNAIYAVTTTTAIMAHHYDARVVVAPDSDDLNQYYPVELFGIRRAQWDAMEGNVCVVYLDNPMGYTHHRRFVSSIQPVYSESSYQVNDYTTFEVYKVAKWAMNTTKIP